MVPRQVHHDPASYDHAVFCAIPVPLEILCWVAVLPLTGAQLENNDCSDVFIQEFAQF